MEVLGSIWHYLIGNLTFLQNSLENIKQVSEGSMAPIVQLTEQSQGVFITEGFPQGIQIIDGSIPVVQGSDGMSIIQIATPQMVSGSNVEGLTQVS